MLLNLSHKVETENNLNTEAMYTLTDYSHHKHVNASANISYKYHYFYFAAIMNTPDVTW